MSFYGTMEYIAAPDGDSIAVGASQTAKVLSRDIRIARGGSLNLVLDVKFSAATVAAGINLKFQDSQDGGVTWNDKKTTAVADTFTGWKTQTYNIEVAADQTHLPFRSLARVVLVTGAGDSATVTSVRVTQGA